uniref:Cilia- and flagella-associated protein 69 ARM repeats domain-containing protein n=1 Tax=Neolamprologus brichardi TaxID=32507 RepID=A0A3Q4HX06_NEOBR
AKSLDLSKVIRLLEDPLTLCMSQKSAKNFFNCLKLLKELTAIAKILNICAEKVTDHPEYVSILLPFLKEKTSDELHYAQDVTEFLSHMGNKALADWPVTAALNTFIYRCKLCCFFCFFFKDRKSHYLLIVLKIKKTGTKFELAKTLLLSMATLENQPTIKLQLLHILQILSSYMNCSSILHAQGAETICLHMNDHDPTGQVLFRSSEILWNLLERGNKEVVTAQLGTLECVLYASLKEAFFHLLNTGSGHSDLQLRNDLLVITTLIAESPGSQLIVSTGQFNEYHNPLIRNLKLSYSNEDLKMKKSLLDNLCDDSVFFSQLYKEERVVLALLALMKPPVASSSERQSGSRHWSAAQKEELQLQALATLATIGPLMLEEYISCEGSTCLLLLLDWCVGPDSYFGQGHSFHATGGRGGKKAQTRHCIRVLRSVTSLGEESVNQDLCDQGIINQLLGILMQIDAGPDEDDVVALEIKSDIQVILSTLCETDMHRKELFGSEGVEMAVHFLKKGSDKFYSGLGHNKLVLSTVDCVWSLDEAQLSFPANVPSAAVLEMSENLRLKIYSVFLKKSEALLKVSDAEDINRDKHQHLSLVVLQVGEVWDEISRELSLEGVRPISPDQEALSTICKIAEDTARRIVEEQNSILEHHQKEDISEEKLTYTEVRSKGVEIAYMKVNLKCFSLIKKRQIILHRLFFFLPELLYK